MYFDEIIWFFISFDHCIHEQFAHTQQSDEPRLFTSFYALSVLLKEGSRQHKTNYSENICILSYFECQHITILHAEMIKMITTQFYSDQKQVNIYT